MNLLDLDVKFRELLKDKLRGHLLLAHEHTRDRITKARKRDLSTHVRYITSALGHAAPVEVEAVQLTEDNAARVKEWLLEQGKGRDVVGNTLTTFKLLRDLAIELGVPITMVPKPERQKRLQIHMKREDGTYGKAVRAPHVVNNAPYGLRYSDWPQHLKDEWASIEAFYTDELADHRNPHILAPKTVAMRQNLAARAFGIEAILGVPAEEMSFRRLASTSTMKAHHRFLNERHGKNTTTMQVYLNQWKSLALNYFEDKATNDELCVYMRKFKWQKVKEQIKQQLPLRVHPDDLYRAWYHLIAEAETYEANLKRKYARAFPEAQMAFHWHRAAVFGFTLVTLLRQENVAGATLDNVIRKEDGTWHYQFEAHQMKGKRPKSDEVIDFWKGDVAQAMIHYVLDKAVAMRPHLVAKFQAQNPDKPIPDCFFLNEDGRGYTHSAMRVFFMDTTFGYLGEEKRISQHDFRTIVPSWLVVREGVEVKPVIQRLLDHKDYATTEGYYIRTEMIFGNRLAKLRMDEQARLRNAHEALARKTDQLAGMIERLTVEIRAMTSGPAMAVDEAAIRQLVSRAVEAGSITSLAPEFSPHR